jgi:hypothetical protein
VLGLGACGNAGRNDKGGAATPERTLTQAELEHSVLPGGTEIGHSTSEVGNGTVRAFSHDLVRPARCVPVLAAANGASRYTPSGSVTRLMPDAPENSLTIVLAGYPAGHAARAMKDLRAALPSCRSFPAAAKGATWSDVEQVAGLGQGDQEVAFRSKVRTSAGPVDLVIRNEVHVIRVGSTIATFELSNVRATPVWPRVPRQDVRRQVEALRKAAAAR